MKLHELKTNSRMMNDLLYGGKNFEYRKNDRDFQTGDLLRLIEEEDSAFGDRKILFEVEYVLYGGKFGIPEDYCIMAIKRVQIVEVKK